MDPERALGDQGGGMRHHVIGQVPRHRIAVQGNGAEAERAAPVAGVRIRLRIGRQVPQDDVPAPVAGNVDEHPLHGGGDLPRHRPAGAVHDHLFGEIDILVRPELMDLRHGRRVAHIVVEGRSRRIGCGLRVFQDGERVIRPVAVVVEQEDVRSDSLLLELRAQTVPDEDLLVFRAPGHGGRVPRVQRLVLDGQGIDPDSLFPHFHDIPGQVAGIHVVAFPAQFRTTYVIFFLHPGRCGPGRGHHPDVRMDGQDLLHHRHHVLQVLRQGEMLQVPVRLTLGHIVVGEDETVHVGGTHRKAHYADIQLSGILAEEFGEDAGAGLGIHLHQEFGTAAGERESEPQHLLVGLPPVHDDGDGTVSALIHESHIGSGGIKFLSVRGRHPLLQRPLSGSGQAQEEKRYENQSFHRIPSML